MSKLFTSICGFIFFLSFNSKAQIQEVTNWKTRSEIYSEFAQLFFKLSQKEITHKKRFGPDLIKLTSDEVQLLAGTISDKTTEYNKISSPIVDLSSFTSAPPAGKHFTIFLPFARLYTYYNKNKQVYEAFKGFAGNILDSREFYMNQRIQLVNCSDGNIVHYPEVYNDECLPVEYKKLFEQAAQEYLAAAIEFQYLYTRAIKIIGSEEEIKLLETKNQKDLQLASVIQKKMLSQEHTMKTISTNADMVKNHAKTAGLLVAFLGIVAYTAVPPLGLSALAIATLGLAIPFSVDYIVDNIMSFKYGDITKKINVYRSNYEKVQKESRFITIIKSASLERDNSTTKTILMP